MEVAKLRAARTLWHRIMSDLGAQKEESKRLRTHCQTSGVSLTEQDPYNNIIRTTIEALAAVLGGTQSLHTNSFDEAIALPTDFSARIARNTQLILAEESGVTAVADPLGGSWYVEKLTRELEQRAWELIEEVEAHGGMTKAVAEGLPKHRIEEAAAARAAKVDTGETVIVGVNRYRLPARIRSRDPRGRQCQGSSRPDRSHRKGPRKPGQCKGARCTLKLGRGRERRGKPPQLSIEAARARATLGEISDALERAFGRYHTKPEPVRGIYGAARSDRSLESGRRRRRGSVASRLGRKPQGS